MDQSAAHRLDDELKLLFITARGLLLSASEHLDHAEQYAAAGDLERALAEIHETAARRSIDAFRQIAVVATRLRELSDDPATTTPMPHT